ncbi:sulfatase family protein [Brevifollis gellanilyticus]|uniref:Sulfatase n=1 Tax=Brevifollis gellanilyticus TaxID=748831 RepID=A0A512M5P9_9BACT|nr:sulfatase [Brevifollis gellanilyticus]GEP42059.1 sulfatase [Brevifollis gellanilyticus]
MRLFSFLALGFALLMPGSPLSAADAKRPNILFCFADDMGRYASIYQQLDGKGTVNDLIKTPNIDRIAKEGVLFKNAHVCAPSCTPCRSSLLSGQYFWRTGRAAILQGAKWDLGIPAYPLLLKDSGYHIGKAYKVWSPGSPADAPYGQQAHAYEKAGRRVNDFSENVTKMVNEGKAVDAAKQELYDEVAGNFDAFIADRKEGQPFCFWYGPTNVHRKWVKGSGAKLWGLDPEQLKGKLPAFLPDVPEVREDLASYFGEIMAFDACIGVLLKKLEALGELDNTLVVVSGDHGAPGFPHGKCNLYDFGTHVTLAVRGAGTKGGRVVDDFVNLMDLAPTFLETGGVTPPEVMTGRSLVKVLQSDKSGQVDPERTSVITGRERHVESAREGYLPYPQRALRTPEYLYIHNFKPDRMPMGDAGQMDADADTLTNNTHISFADMDSSPTKAWIIGERANAQWKQHFDWAFAQRPREELYVIGKDPFEVKNVADDPEYATIRDQMRERLMAELKRTKDPRVENDGAFFETAPMAGPLPDDIMKPNRAKGGNKGKGKGAGKKEE